MARTKTSTSSASSEKVTTVKGEVGRPNQSVAAIREQYKLEEEKQKANFANASEDKVMRALRDLSKNVATPNLTTTTKETIRGYLTGNIYSNAQNLIMASKYLYFRSPIYAQIIDKYASMYCFDCRIIEPEYDFVKGIDTNKALKSFNDTLGYLDILSLQNNIKGPLTNMWLCDVSFNLYFKDDFGAFFYPIDPSEAVIDGIYETSNGFVFSEALDMTKWRSQTRQQLIEFLGEPLLSMYHEYESSGIKYVHVPVEYSFVIKKRINSYDTIIPPLLPYLNQLANLNDLVDSQALADDVSFYKLIYLPLKTLNSAKNADDFEITPDLAIDYFKIAADSAIPSGVSSAVIPGDELKTIDFSDNVSEDVNRVENSQQQILGGMSGMGALINANKAINNTELIKNALRAESSYALSGVLEQVEAWTNLQLSIELSNYCKTKYFPITIYTKEDFRKNLLEANQYGFTYRLAYGTLLGFSERQTMAALKFETEALGLQNLMIYPLQSSYTSSGDSEKGQVGEGRPEKDSGDLSPSGERARNQ